MKSLRLIAVLYGMTSAAGLGEAADLEGHRVFSGMCSYRVGQIQRSRGPCPQVIDLYLPSAEERQRNVTPTLTVNLPTSDLPPAVLEFGRTSQGGPGNNDIIYFSPRSRTGAQTGLASGEALQCSFIQSPSNGNAGKFPNLPPNATLTCSPENIRSQGNSFLFIADRADIASIREAFIAAYDALNPNQPFISPGSPAEAAATRTAIEASQAPVPPIFGLTLGAAFPSHLPRCSPTEARGTLGGLYNADPRKQPVLCVGTTEGGLDQQGVRRWRGYRLIPVMPSDASLAAEFPALAGLRINSNSVFAIVDGADVVQGLNISSVTIDGDRMNKVIVMLDRRYGPGGTVVPKRFVTLADSNGNREEVTVNYSVWKRPNVYVRFGPPENLPRSAYRDLQIFGPKLAREVFGVP